MWCPSIGIICKTGCLSCPWLHLVKSCGSLDTPKICRGPKHVQQQHHHMLVEPCQGMPSSLRLLAVISASHFITVQVVCSGCHTMAVIGQYGGRGHSGALIHECHDCSVQRGQA